MQKFSKIQNEPQIAPKNAATLWQGSHLKVLALDEWEVVAEKDMVVALPYFVERNEVMVRAEQVPPYQYREPAHQHFLTLMSGSVEDGESPEQALRRELREEMGIVLTDRFKPEMLGQFMVSKGNTARYHIYILPLMQQHYQQVPATTDGSRSEKKSSNVMVSTRKLKNLSPVDLVTAYVVGAFVAKHQLNF